MQGTLVRLERVLALANPTTDWPWCAKLSGAGSDVLAASGLVQASAAVAEPSDAWEVADEETQARKHLGRVKYLMEAGWEDAIELDVGCPCLGYDGPAWRVVDGNHRLAAAALRGDEWILVNVAGQLDHAAELLGVPEEDLMGEEHSG